jgi:hypothetical protein
MDITSTIVKGRETGASNKEKRKEKKHKNERRW